MKSITGIIFAAAITLAAGTASADRWRTSNDAPPAARHEHVRAKRGYVFVQGSWERTDAGWQWVPGHYERARADRYYQQGSWDQGADGQYDWHDGGWRDNRDDNGDLRGNGSAGDNRDNRDNQRSDDSQRGRRHHHNRGRNRGGGNGNGGNL